MVNSFMYAFKGIRYVCLVENNFRFHLLATLIVCSAGFYFGISKVDWIVILACCGAVLSMEMVNTAIEKLVDLVSPEYNKQAGLVKDLLAGAVLLVAVFSVVIGGLVFWKYLV